MVDARRTLLTPGNEDAWARLNAEKRAAQRPAPGTPVRELIDEGVTLSRTALELLQAVGDGRRPTPT